MPQKIIILGLGKSGTTALYYKIKHALPDTSRCLFEPKLVHSEILCNDDQNVLVKVILRPPGEAYDGAQDLFQKKILIVRDPRDLFVSRILYVTAYHFLPELGFMHALTFLKNLNEKIKRPRAVSLLKLYSNLPKKVHLMNTLLENFFEQHRFLCRSAWAKCCFIMKYEDMVQGHLRPLESYLGLKLERETDVDKVHARVVRTKQSGLWRFWFTEEDVNYFRPRLAEFMEKFGYDNSEWGLRNERKITPGESTGYVKKVLREKLKKRSLHKRLLLYLFPPSFK